MAPKKIPTRPQFEEPGHMGGGGHRGIRIYN